MFEGGPNPTRVQLAPPYKRKSGTPPLVLIHDGGGTTFSYFILGALNRDVWAIHNPNYWDSGIMEGGMDAMARHYIELIEKAGISGPIMLGGWSLGGFLSLTIARMVADNPDSKFSIAGMLIIDSPWHIPRSRVRKSTVEPELSSFPELVQKCFDNCDVMLENWELPKWDAPAGGDKEARIATGGRSFNIKSNEFIYKPLDEDWRVESFDRHDHKESSENPKAPPPAVLLRCVQPVKKATESADPALIDLWRKEVLLGWESNYPDFIKATIDVDADHYNIFERTQMAKMKTLTAQLNQGLEMLESLNGPKKAPMMDFF